MFGHIVNIIKHAKYLHKSFSFIRFETKEQARSISKFIDNEDRNKYLKNHSHSNQVFPMIYI